MSEDRPSLHATIDLDGQETVRVHVVHPTPPGLEQDDGDGRHDSRIRDAELVMLAERIRENPGEARLVLGDLNDTAWSRTTRLFLRISGLLDPRRGRGMYSTFPARKPLMRYPIDHVFVSRGFGRRELRRVLVPGSDHLGIWIDVSLNGEVGAKPRTVGDDHEHASEIVDEGMDDAKD